MYGLQHLAVVLQFHLRRKSSLQADLSGSQALCFCGTIEDRLGREKIALSLFKRAEPAGADASVSEVDVPVDDKGYCIPAALLAQGIGEAEEADGLHPQSLQFISIGIWIEG